LRAFVIVSLTPSQFSNLETDILDVFDSPIHLSGLEKSNIQSLVDKRVQKKAKQRWILSEKILRLLYDNTSGNPRELINILQNLVDEHRGVGATGSLEKLLGWNCRDDIQKDNSKEAGIFIENDRIVASDEISDHFNIQGINENDIIEDKNIVTPDEISDHFNVQEIEEDIGDNDKSHIQEVEVLEKISTENDDFTLINWSEDFEKIEYEDETIETQEDNNSDSTWKEKENILQEFPDNSNKDHFGAFGGMISRSREVPKKYSKVDEIANEEYIDASINVIEESIVRDTFVSEDVKNNNNKFHEQRKIEKHDDKLVFDTEGEVWTVDKKNEQTLPKNPYSNEKMISQDTILQEPAFDEPMFETIIPEENPIESEVNYEVENIIEKSSIIKSKITLSPKWDADEPFNSEYASQLSDTEILIVSKAMEREISPSDSELQALLQVGRPRLSQLYNALNKAGILSVRKKGRSRLFRISESAQSYF
jgi:DNA-binding transcriptional ArsR family regulator